MRNRYGLRFCVTIYMNPEIYDVIIIGSGPAGLTAGIYATRGALKTLVVAGYKWGGQLQLTTEVDNFPGFDQGIQGPELMQKMRVQAERFGAKILDVDAEKVDFSRMGGEGEFGVVGGGETYKGRSVIIATGAETQWLGLPSEQKLIGRGVSSCAPCDAPFFRDKRVIVVGGGDSAMEEALVLTKYATEVTVVHRRDAFRASKIMQDKVLTNPKIKVVWNSGVEEILGEEKVTGVRLKDVNTGQVREVTTDGVFVAIGHKPATDLYKGQVELDEKGYVKKVMSVTPVTSEEKKEMVHSFQTATSVEGVFVAGDVHDHHYRQAVTAAAFGCMAAMDVERWLGIEPATR